MKHGIDVFQGLHEVSSGEIVNLDEPKGRVLFMVATRELYLAPRAFLGMKRK
jgi:hypothetical protein